MKRFLMMVAVAMMTAMSAQAQKIEVVDAYANAHNLPALSSAARQAIGKLKQW
jgi:hypothetical protein